METTLDIAGLAKAVLWPIVLLVVLVHYRTTLADLALKIGQRIQSIKIGDFSLELAEAKELRTPGWSGGAVDLRRAGQPNDVNDSTQRAFYEQFKDPSRLDFAVIDIGAGQSWLTSRLFILGIILRRMRGLKAFVFVESAEAERRRYIGIADSEKVCWRLAPRYPWLEPTLGSALAGPDLAFARVVDDEGRLGLEQDPNSPEAAGTLLRAFLSASQNPQPQPGTEQWTPLPSVPPTFERALWLERDDLIELLGDALDPTHLQLEDLQLRREEEQAKAVLRHGGRFVAITRDERVFHRLVDRWQLVEAAAKRCVE